MSDRLTLTHAIEDAGIERAKAERMASVIFDAIRDEVATKAELKATELALNAELKATEFALKAELKVVELALKTELKVAEAALKAELKVAEAALKSDIAAVRTELKADIQAVRANVDLIEHRLLTRLGALMIVVGGVLFAALHYWPPGAH